jgi:hypothetical protein
MNLQSTEYFTKLNLLDLSDYFMMPDCVEVDPVAVRSKTWAYGRSLSVIAGSNPAEGVDSCLL